MQKTTKATFLVHMIVAGLTGFVLWAAPGRFLTLLGWAPIDPIISRFLGAALLACALSSYRGWRAADFMQVAALVEIELVFTSLACAGLLRHILFGWWPLMVWILFGILVAFALAWGAALVRK